MREKPPRGHFLTLHSHSHPFMPPLTRSQTKRKMDSLYQPLSPHGSTTSNMEGYVNQLKMSEESISQHIYSPTFVDFLNERELHHKFDQFLDNHKDEFFERFVKHGTRLLHSFD